MVRERAIGYTISSYNLYTLCHVNISQGFPLDVHVPFMEYDLQTSCASNMAPCD